MKISPHTCPQMTQLPQDCSFLLLSGTTSIKLYLFDLLREFPLSGFDDLSSPDVLQHCVSSSMAVTAWRYLAGHSKPCRGSPRSRYHAFYCRNV